MKADQASRLHQSLDRFVRWFFNVSPTAQLDTPRPATRPVVVTRKIRAAEPRRPLRHGVLTKALRER